MAEVRASTIAIRWSANDDEERKTEGCGEVYLELSQN